MAGVHSSQVLTVALERPEPTACAKSLPRLEELSKEWWNSTLLVLHMDNPCDLMKECTKKYGVLNINSYIL